MKLFLYSFRDFDEAEFFDALQKTNDFSYAWCAAYPSLENAHLAQGFDAVSATPFDFNAALLERFRALGVRYILSRSIGYDHIDLARARALGLRVAHVTYAPQTVADYAIMLMMMSLRRMRQIMDRAAVQDYTLSGKIGRTLGECTVGVVGTGKIGRTVLSHLQPFGCRLLACDPVEDPALAPLCTYVPLDRLLRESDVVTLHAPASAENYHLLDRRTFGLMKPGAIVVNTARGALVDADALIEALESGRLDGAALDVMENETGLYYANRVGDCIANAQMARLRSFPNVLLTPHTAFYTREVVRGMAENLVQCMFDLENGRENPLVVV